MGRVPVLGTVSLAYGFLLGELGTIFRLVWAPLLVGSALSYFYGGQAIDAAVAAGVGADSAVAMAYLPVQFLIGVVNFVTGVMALVVLFQVVLFGDRKPGLYFYLWLGGAELRLILVTVLLILAVVAGGVGVGIVLGILGTVAAPILTLVALIGGVVGLFAAVRAAIRLTLISAVVVAENNLGVERAWAISRGNALRLLGVLVLTFGPYVFVASILFFSIMGSDMPALPSPPDLEAAGGAKNGAAAREAAAAYAKALEVWQLDLLKGMRAHWLALTILGFAGNVVTTALWACAMGSAYLSIVRERAA
jgi:hypothetical protein